MRRATKQFLRFFGDLESCQLRYDLGTLEAGDVAPYDFVNDVMPWMTRLGCNSGACHGKASGQKGFKLSVFGFDPASDYTAIVKEARGRR